jgi:hypothetical protein
VFKRKTPNPNTCKFCPYKYEEGCPDWVDESWGLVETNIQTGETRLTTGCLKHIIVRTLGQMFAACNRPAAAIESTRNEIVVGFTKVAEALNKQQEYINNNLRIEKK